MRILLFAIFVLLTINNVYTQVFYCPPATNWYRISDTAYVRLSAAAKQHIRQKALYHHQLYLQFYKNEDRRLARKQNQLCRMLNKGFVDLHEIFPQNTSAFVLQEPQEDIQTDETFLIFDYASIHFNQYRLRWTITNVPNEMWPGIQRIGGGDTDGEPNPKYLRKHPDLRSHHHISILQDTAGNIYHFDDACIFSPLYIEIAANTLGDTMQYAMFKFHESSNKTAGVVAVNIADSSDIHFLAGPFIPLGFNVPINQFIDQLAQRSMEDPIHSNWVRRDLMKQLELDENFDFTHFNGVLEYAKHIASLFMYMPKQSKMLAYKDGYYTVEVKSSFHLISINSKARRHYCKKVTALPGEPYRGQGMRMLQGEKIVRVRGINAPPYLLCSDFNGRIVSNMHIRIHPETGDVKMKIMDTANLRRIPECPQ